MFQLRLRLLKMSENKGERMHGKENKEEKQSRRSERARAREWTFIFLVINMQGIFHFVLTLHMEQTTFIGKKGRRSDGSCSRAFFPCCFLRSLARSFGGVFSFVCYRDFAQIKCWLSSSCFLCGFQKFLLHSIEFRSAFCLTHCWSFDSRDFSSFQLLFSLSFLLFLSVAFFVCFVNCLHA